MRARLALLLLVSSTLTMACATARHPEPDPATDPTIIGAVDTASQDATEAVASPEAVHAATVGRRVGTVVGVVSAIFGSSSEPIEQSIDRYRRIRNAGESIGLATAVAPAATRGWQRGLAFDQQMAALKNIDGVELYRPAPDQIDVYFAHANTTNLAAIACAVEGRTLEVEGGGGTSFDVRDALIDHGIPRERVSSHRNDTMQGVVLHVRME